MTTLKLSGNMRVIDFDPQTGQSDVDTDPRDERIAELEAALRVFVDAETNENMGYATKADAIMRAVILARRALNPSIELNLSDKETE